MSWQDWTNVRPLPILPSSYLVLSFDLNPILLNPFLTSDGPFESPNKKPIQREPVAPVSEN